VAAYSRYRGTRWCPASWSATYLCKRSCNQWNVITDDWGASWSLSTTDNRKICSSSRWSNDWGGTTHRW